LIDNAKVAKDEAERIRADAQAGMSYNDLREKHDRCLDTISSTLHGEIADRHGLPHLEIPPGRKRRFTDEEVRLIYLEATSRRSTMKDVARRHEVSYGFVRQVVAGTRRADATAALRSGRE